jgi:PadR family transcriptional regulator, regulatory protein PadR
MNDETQLIKGILEGCILELLSRGATYGYRVVERLTEAGLETNEATVYPILTRLLKQNALQVERRPSPYGPERKYYSLTKEGEQLHQRFLSSWVHISNSVNCFLER